MVVALNLKIAKWPRWSNPLSKSAKVIASIVFSILVFALLVLGKLKADHRCTFLQKKVDIETTERWNILTYDGVVDNGSFLEWWFPRLVHKHDGFLLYGGRFLHVQNHLYHLLVRHVAPGGGGHGHWNGQNVTDITESSPPPPRPSCRSARGRARTLKWAKRNGYYRIISTTSSSVMSLRAGEGTGTEMGKT